MQGIYQWHQMQQRKTRICENILDTGHKCCSIHDSVAMLQVLEGGGGGQTVKFMKNFTFTQNKRGNILNEQHTAH
jgi:hypothetical protein